MNAYDPMAIYLKNTERANLTKRQAYGRNDNIETNSTPRYYTIGFVPVCSRNRSFNPFFLFTQNFI